MKDGGPAFPHPGNIMAAQAQAGMSLRDYMAAMVMSRIFAGEGARTVAMRDGRYDQTNWAEVVAANAYEMADAMLVARGK